MIVRIAPALLLALLLVNCGGQSPSEEGSVSSDAQPATMSRTASAPGAAVFFINPLDGAKVNSPVAVKFGISGMSVTPAGTYAADTGHHHLLIDGQLANADQPIPSDGVHMHFGKGQTETALELTPGEHTLQLVLGDGNHVPHEPPVMSNAITITVE